ncbi:hypothetical protein EVAR_44837_1 [Eumeta japonica]|uniref:Uncharacterized protein n=1 Tax=Eumeta variegata TaxID=151549 RepID=A0A4C1YNX5_EUMVA|nr:hypothetical protein EVAR_44837_1 [Eumeta japonica]
MPADVSDVTTRRHIGYPSIAKRDSEAESEKLCAVPMAAVEDFTCLTSLHRSQLVGRGNKTWSQQNRCNAVGASPTRAAADAPTGYAGEEGGGGLLPPQVAHSS